MPQEGEFNSFLCFSYSARYSSSSLRLFCLFRSRYSLHLAALDGSALEKSDSSDTTGCSLSPKLDEEPEEPGLRTSLIVNGSGPGDGGDGFEEDDSSNDEGLTREDDDGFWSNPIR